MIGLLPRAPEFPWAQIMVGAQLKNGQPPKAAEQVFRPRLRNNRRRHRRENRSRDARGASVAEPIRPLWLGRFPHSRRNTRMELGAAG
jgi:hypothetical protein